MAELTARNTHATAIRNILAYTTNDQFQARYIREVRTRLNHLRNVWAKFERNHLLLVERANENEEAEEVQQHEALYTEIEDNYLDAEARLEDRIREVAEADEEQLSDHESNLEEDRNELERNNMNNEPGNLREVEQPPQMQQLAPQQGDNQLGALIQRMYMGLANKKENTWGKFNGTWSQWQGFHDGFKAAVHDDPLITPVFKFQLLKSSLEGNAAAALGEWQITDRNYYEAWDFLTELYARQYQTSKQILWKLFDFPKLERASGKMIGKLNSTAQGVVRQLRAMEFPVEHYDLIFVHAIHDKLDAQTSKDWELFRKSEKPSLKEMLTFLQQHGRALSSAQYEEPEKSKDNRKRPFNGKNNQKGDYKRAKYTDSTSSHAEQKPDTKSENRKCKVCSEAHPVHKCPKFLKFSLAERKEKARELNLCFNCLFPSHNARDCTSSYCKRCLNKKHNSLLCDQNPYNKPVNTGYAKKPRKKNRKRAPKTEPEQQAQQA